MISNDEVIAVVKGSKSLTDEEKNQIISAVPNLTEEQKQQILQLGEWSRENMQVLKMKYEMGMHEALVKYQQEMSDVYNTTKMSDSARQYEMKKFQTKLQKVHNALVGS